MNVLLFEHIRLSRRHWLLMIVLCALSLTAFARFTRPQLEMVPLTVDRNQATTTARRYLRTTWGQNPSAWRQAVVFYGDDETDQFLQNALGFGHELNYLKQHGKDLFVWKIRFFKELQKEEFIIDVSALTGRITAHTHTIPDSEARPLIERDVARDLARRFLNKQGIKAIDDDSLFAQSSRRFDQRIDHFFQWEMKGSQIPWRTTHQTVETGRIVHEVRVSGNEIRTFSLKRFLVPDAFKRYLERLQETGRNLSQAFSLIYFLLLSAAVYLVLIKRQHSTVHIVKKPALIMTALLFLAVIWLRLSAWDVVLFQYPTTAPLATFTLRQIIEIIHAAVLITVTFLMPFLAGETLHPEIFPKHPEGRACSYLLTKGWWRHPFLPKIILLGYATAVIMIGIQSIAFAAGQRWLGVWIQHSWLTQFSNNRFPALASALAALLATFSEEASFRLFGLTWGVKFFRRTSLALLITSFFWGLGHSHYMVFPMWFRTLEVGLMGLFLGRMYLRFGLLPAVIGHYVFDVFWGSCPYLLGLAGWGQAVWHYCALLWPALLLLPPCLFPKKPQSIAPVSSLNAAQKFNLEILKAYLNQQPQDPETLQALKKRLLALHWDPLVVEEAFHAVQKKSLKNDSNLIN